MAKNEDKPKIKPLTATHLKSLEKISEGEYDALRQEVQRQKANARGTIEEHYAKQYNVLDKDKAKRLSKLQKAAEKARTDLEKLVADLEGEGFVFTGYGIKVDVDVKENQIVHPDFNDVKSEEREALRKLEDMAMQMRQNVDSASRETHRELVINSFEDEGPRLLLAAIPKAVSDIDVSKLLPSGK